ncbi:MAG: HNH endonuclease [Scytonema sp. PMC 1069.18]|nr:HNH endonuclease [Scytonema sp. PMC 1069.18]MEC4886139.1 HNH endonuclease [Scytonema sp. PMC 1070.18]
MRWNQKVKDKGTLSKGGKDEHRNLQLLHRHCHDVKTAKDGLALGMQ